jgi:hypothetical protein
MLPKFSVSLLQSKRPQSRKLSRNSPVPISQRHHLEVHTAKHKITKKLQRNDFGPLLTPHFRSTQFFNSTYARGGRLGQLIRTTLLTQLQVAAADHLVYYTEAVEEDPSHANALASSLVTLRNRCTHAQCWFPPRDSVLFRTY